MNKQSLKTAVSRRRMLKFGASAVGGGLVAAGLGKTWGESEAAIASEILQTTTPDPRTPDEALQLLIKGNQRFSSNKIKHPNQDVIRLREVAVGQKPFAAILGCADSRVPSELCLIRD